MNKHIEPHQDKIEEAGGTPWSRGGGYVYGDDELSEGLYALEDEAIILPDVEGKYIPYERMQDVMMLYRERLKRHVKKIEDIAYQKGREEGIEEQKKYDAISHGIQESKVH